MIKGAIGRSQDVPVLHVKLSHSRMWDRPSSCLDLYRFYRQRRSSNRTCDPEAPHRHACKVSGFTVDCYFFGDTGHAGDFRFILRWTNNTAVVTRSQLSSFFIRITPAHVKFSQFCELSKTYFTRLVAKHTLCV